MKILSIAVPCYNSEAYMRNCIDSLLVGGEEVEIIIVNDGSKDKTAEIADEYQSKYPTIVKAVHKENGGHGDAVNAGLKNASGTYFKVVDSDDWVNSKAYHKIINLLRSMLNEENQLDMLLSNFVYEKQDALHKKVMHYHNALPMNQIVTWDDPIHFKKYQYILMHSVIYRTQLLIDCGLELPKHTFYVDNIFVFQPLPYVKKIYYLDVNFYRYFIGRDDQSVNEKVMISRVDQQIRVNKIMIDIYNRTKIENKKLDQYMLQYLDMMMCIASIMLILSKKQENLKKKQELWEYLRQTSPELYGKLRHTVFGLTMNLPGKTGRSLSVGGYKLVQKIFGFN